MELYYCSPSKTFVALTAHQFVWCDDGLLEQQKQDSHVCRRNRTFPLILRKNQSPHYKAKATKSKKLRIRNRTLDMCWM